MFAVPSPIASIALSCLGTAASPVSILAGQRGNPPSNETASPQPAVSTRTCPRYKRKRCRAFGPALFHPLASRYTGNPSCPPLGAERDKRNGVCLPAQATAGKGLDITGTLSKEENVRNAQCRESPSKTESVVGGKLGGGE